MTPKGWFREYTVDPDKVTFNEENLIRAINYLPVCPGPGSKLYLVGVPKGETRRRTKKRFPGVKFIV
jgi:hypothetical protein